MNLAAEEKKPALVLHAVAATFLLLTVHILPFHYTRMSSLEHPSQLCGSHKLSYSIRVAQRKPSVWQRCRTTPLQNAWKTFWGCFPAWPGARLADARSRRPRCRGSCSIWVSADSTSRQTRLLAPARGCACSQQWRWDRCFAWTIPPSSGRGGTCFWPRRGRFGSSCGTCARSRRGTGTWQQGRGASLHKTSVDGYLPMS